MTSNQKKSKIIEFNIHNFFTMILRVGILSALFFGHSGLSVVNAQAVEKQNYEDLDLNGNRLDPLMPETDQVIIRYKASIIGNTPFDPASANQMQRISEAAGVSLIYLREMSGNATVYRLPGRMSSAALQVIIQRLQKLPEVEYAEPDIIMQHTRVPNDPRYSEQWHYFAPTTGTYGINAPPAWDITTGSANIVVAVVDTGITNHIEFVGRTVPGYDFIIDSLVANDGDARDSDPSDPGDWVLRNECYPGSKPADSSWHGTHTAGTIGAASNNTTGVAGINWNSKLLPVRVLGKCGGYMSDISDGMRWAAGLSVSGVPANPNPAKVINVSLGGSGSCGISLQTNIDAIIAAGTTIVASAGNDNADASGFTPANCNDVITVAATNRIGSKAYYSNFGSSVEISAPGGDSYGYILSTLNTGVQGPVDDTYVFYQGTSMAAPHVSGVASLLYSINPSLTPSQVLAILQDTATPFPTGSACSTTTCGSGIVNAGEAVTQLPTSVELVSFTATGTDTSVIMNWETATEITNLGFNLYRSETLSGERTQVNPELIASSAPGSLTGSAYEYSDSSVINGLTYYYWLEDQDTSGRKTLHGPVQAQAAADPLAPWPVIFLPAIFSNH